VTKQKGGNPDGLKGTVIDLSARPLAQRKGKGEATKRGPEEKGHPRRCKGKPQKLSCGERGGG